jgi:hypothetical protein
MLSRINFAVIVFFLGKMIYTIHFLYFVIEESTSCVSVLVVL